MVNLLPKKPEPLRIACGETSQDTGDSSNAGTACRLRRVLVPNPTASRGREKSSSNLQARSVLSPEETRNAFGAGLEDPTPGKPRTHENIESPETNSGLAARASAQHCLCWRLKRLQCPRTQGGAQNVRAACCHQALSAQTARTHSPVGEGARRRHTLVGFLLQAGIQETRERCPLRGPGHRTRGQGLRRGLSGQVFIGSGCWV